jgi:hypothetical protein
MGIVGVVVGAALVASCSSASPASKAEAFGPNTLSGTVTAAGSCSQNAEGRDVIRQMIPIGLLSITKQSYSTKGCGRLLAGRSTVRA